MMMESSDSVPQSGKAVLIKKGQVIPENAVPMSDDDVISIQEKRITNFKNQSEMRVFTWGQGTIGTSVAVSATIINHFFRQSFKLGGLRKTATYLPAVVVPTVASLVIHDIAIKKQILVGKEECPLCTSLRSGAVQIASGVLYPVIISFLGCLPIAREYYTLPMPLQNSGSLMGTYLRLFRHVSPSLGWILGLAAAQMVIGMKMANVELRVYHQHLRHPPTSSELIGTRYGK